MESTALRMELRERGFRQASRFRWKETARRTWEVYRAVHLRR